MNPIFKVQNGNQIDIHMRVNAEQGPREITIVSDIKVESYANCIVRACNCHEELLKTCKDMMFILANIDFSSLTIDYDSIAWDEWAHALTNATK